MDGPWLTDGNNFYLESPPIPGFESLCVNDLMIPMSQEWDSEFLEELFCARDVEAILNIPLRRTPRCDSRIWHFTKNGGYFVKMGHRAAMEAIFGMVEDRVDGNWQKLWKLQVPPRVKMMLWQACRDFLPTRERLQHRGM